MVTAAEVATLTFQTTSALSEYCIQHNISLSWSIQHPQQKIITAVELNLLCSTLTSVLSLITYRRLDHLFQKGIQDQTEAQKVVNKSLLQTVFLLY